MNPVSKKNKRPSPWQEDTALEESSDPLNEPDDKPSTMKTVAKTLIVVSLLSVAGFGYYYFFLRIAGPNVGLEFSKPDQILVGQPFSLAVSFSNYSDQILKSAKLSVLLPDGIAFLNGTPAQRVMEQNVGDIGPGSLNQQTFTLIAIKGGQTLARVEARLGYQTAGSSAEFQGHSEVDLPIGQPAVTLNFDVPQNVFSGESFDITVRYQNNSNEDFKNFQLRVDYPPVFQFTKSSVDPSRSNNQWKLGTLAKGSNGSFRITGSLIGPEQSYFNFHGLVTAEFLGQTYGISDQTASTVISASPLSLVPSLNNSSDYVSHIGDDVTYVLKYKNNSNVTIENIVVKAVLTGELFDFATLRSNASFDSLTRIVTWMTANTPALGAVGPGREGSVDLEIRLKSDFPIHRISDKNYTLKLNAQIESLTVPQGINASKTMSVANLENKVAGKLNLRVKALWRDSPAGIVNKGPYPPLVNRPTQYTVHWLVSNYATDASAVTVSSFLQSGARWTGVVKSNIDSQPSYDAASGKITWNVGTLIATKGVISPAAEAVFQIELTPAVNQLGQFVTFLGDTQVQGQDNFANLTLSDKVRALDTSLPDDASVTNLSNKTVQQ